jgi:hypothetical protein
LLDAPNKAPPIFSANFHSGKFLFFFQQCCGGGAIAARSTEFLLLEPEEMVHQNVFNFALRGSREMSRSRIILPIPIQPSCVQRTVIQCYKYSIIVLTKFFKASLGKRAH